LSRKWLPLVTALAAVLSIVACTEKLDSGNQCPLLCPQEAVALRDTTIDAIVEDTTVTGLPPIGQEAHLMLSSHGDTLETRAIIRFDTLPQTYTKNSLDSTIVNIDTAMVVAPIVRDTLHPIKAPVTIEVYDVDPGAAIDTTLGDTVTANIAGLFTVNRLIGSKTFAPESLLDTLRIPISTDTVLDRVRNGTKLRVGLRARSTTGVDLQIGSSNSSDPVTLRIVASTDTAARPVTVSPFSSTPKDQLFLSGPLADYTIVLRGQTTSSPTLLAVGGVPSRRAYFRFDVPSRLVDSTTIVRASLLLTQLPNRRVNQRDSIYVYPAAVLSQGTISNVASALGFLGPNGQFGLDSLRIAPGDSGVRAFEIVGLVRTWKGQTTEISPRTLGLRSGVEGERPNEIDFFSTRGPVGVRPRLRITYVPQQNYGIP
jgi:hypothetical protein